MRTGTTLKFSAGATLLFAASSAKAHLIHGNAEAAAHNVSHAMPIIGLVLFAALIGATAYRCFKS
jgi:hypothetical protein